MGWGDFEGFFLPRRGDRHVALTGINFDVEESISYGRCIHAKFDPINAGMLVIS